MTWVLEGCKYINMNLLCWCILWHGGLMLYIIVILSQFTHNTWHYSPNICDVTFVSLGVCTPVSPCVSTMCFLVVLNNPSILVCLHLYPIVNQQPSLLILWQASHLIIIFILYNSSSPLLDVSQVLDMVEWKRIGR